MASSVTCAGAVGGRSFARVLHEQYARIWGCCGARKFEFNDELIREITKVFVAPGCCSPEILKTVTLGCPRCENYGHELTEVMQCGQEPRFRGLFFAHPQSRYFAVAQIPTRPIRRLC